MLIKILNKLLSGFQYQIVNSAKSKEFPPDFESLHQNIYNKVKEYTMTSPERIWTLIEAVKYVQKNEIEGAIVECGVWKGGSMMSVISTLQHLSVTDKELFLYDTFEGMSEPTEHDVDHSKQSAEKLLEKPKTEQDLVWAYSPLDAVKERIYSTGYDKNLIHFVKGKVEETIPATIPEKIAILRLDTDWYESTKHELEHLFPLLSENGILIIDDYGHWEGARKAVDEYIKNNNLKLFLSRIDYTGRIAIKSR